MKFEESSLAQCTVIHTFNPAIYKRLVVIELGHLAHMFIYAYSDFSRNFFLPRSPSGNTQTHHAL